MQFIPTTKEEEAQLIQEMGATDFSELVDIIPTHLRSKHNLGIGEPLSEMEINKDPYEKGWIIKLCKIPKDVSELLNASAYKDLIK